LSNLTISDPSPQQLVLMGDGVLAGGDVVLAEGLYRSALKRAKPEHHPAILQRLGLCEAQVMTKMHLDVLRTVEPQAIGSTFVGTGLATWWKTLPFFEDKRFMALSDKHAHLLPLANWHWNLSTALWAVQQARNVPGDLVELGVFRGHTTLFCAEYVDFQVWPKRWWLYDTFDGIPADQLAPGWEGRNKSIYGDTFSFEEVRDRFAHIPNIDVIKGRVPEILATHGAPDTIAFMHIDMNNPSAEIAALDALFDRLSPGGLILFDDYCWATARAQFVAERAWFAERGLQVLPMPTGQGLFVKR